MEYALVRVGCHDETDGPVSLEFARPQNQKKYGEEKSENPGADQLFKAIQEVEGINAFIDVNEQYQSSCMQSCNGTDKVLINDQLIFSQILEEEHESESNFQSGQHTGRSSISAIHNRNNNAPSGSVQSKQRNFKGPQKLSLPQNLGKAGILESAALESQESVESKTEETRMEIDCVEFNLFEPQAMFSPKNP